VDGFVGGQPVSIKPASYKAMAALPEMLPCEIIYYEKVKDGLTIEFAEPGEGGQG
jgi:hypothetical protein